MAKITARNAYIRLGNRDFSGDANSVDFPRTVAMTDVSAFGNNFTQWVEGLQDGKLTVNAWWDNGTAAADMDATLNGFLQGGLTRYDFAPAGSATGRIAYSGSAFLTTYGINNVVAGAVAASIALQGNGSVTRSLLA